MNFLFAACHIGQALALKAVIAQLLSQGHRATVCLEFGETAWNAYDHTQSLAFPGCEVFGYSNQAGDALSYLQRFVDQYKIDRVFSMISPTPKDKQTIETLLLQVGCDARIPRYGYAEVSCGHRAPAWNGLLSRFERLFVAQKTPDISSWNWVVEVGMEIPILDLDRAAQTKRRLGLASDELWIWHSGGPYCQAAQILGHVINWASHKNLKIVFTRHGRDRRDPNDAGKAYQQVVASLGSVDVQENSSGFTSEETTFLQRTDLVPYGELLEACALGGNIVTGHGTDGIKVAHLRIPSVLCVGDTFDPHIREEKGCPVLPLPANCPFQVQSVPELRKVLDIMTSDREDYASRCQNIYPKQSRTPAQLICAEITAS